MVDERLKGNRRRGAVFEAFIYLIFDFVVDTLNLKNKIRVLHNPFTYRKYISREGLGIDILVQYKKWTGNWIQLFAVEVKDWKERFMSPKVFVSHVLKRFWNICKPTKILITKGVKYSQKTLHKIVNNGYKLIDNNYVNRIRELIVNITNKYNITRKPVTITPINNTNMSNSVDIHKTRFNDIYNTPIPDYIKIQTYNKHSILCGG